MQKTLDKPKELRPHLEIKEMLKQSQIVTKSKLLKPKIERLQIKMISLEM
jgi:hypothetical protein